MGYNARMDANHKSPGMALILVVATLACIVITDIVFAVGFIAGHAEIILAFPGLVGGAILVWLIARWTNRRDESSLSKRPPDIR